MLRQAVESLVFDWDAAVQAAAGAVTAAMESGGAEDAERRREQAEKLRRKRLRALDAFLEGAITQAELRGLTEQYDGRLARLQAQPAAAAGLQEAAERLRAALRRESVSYTHLDVYKRQAQCPHHRRGTAASGA